jgi:Transposase domain (DUF772)
MMSALLLYAYSQGVYSSRRISRGCEERVDFIAVTAMQRPDFRAVSEFRRRHLGALEGLFKQVLRLCQKARMVKLGHVALDGTKIEAAIGCGSRAQSVEACITSSVASAAGVISASCAARFAEGDSWGGSSTNVLEGTGGPTWVVTTEPVPETHVSGAGS